jgi:hypothetical protein
VIRWMAVAQHLHSRSNNFPATTIAMASLLTLPLELLVAVSSHLTTPDLGALRLTCKQTEKSLYEWFSREFFTKKQFMLTSGSLQALVDIAKHKGFSQKLTHVIIATNVYTEIPLRFRDNEAAARYLQGFQDQKTLINMGIDREMLTEAFANLANLQTVGIRDFNNHERARDGINWTSYGAPTVYKETGIELQFSTRDGYAPQHFKDYLARLFQNIIYALGKAGRNPPELEVLLRRDALPDGAFHVPEFIHPHVESVLAGFTKLLLRVDTKVDHMYTHTNGTLSDFESARLLRRFLGHTSNLEHLRLNLLKYQLNENQQFLQWLSSPAAPVLTTIDSFSEPPPISLDRLTTLELGQFTARWSVIISVILKFEPTLRHLELWKITLSDAQAVPSHDPRPNMWKHFFTRLSKLKNLQLDHLKVGMLSQDLTHVQFKNPLSDDAPGLKVKQHTGLKMDAFLKELIDNVFVQWPVDVDFPTDSDEDEDEEMEDDYDDDADENDEEDDSEDD